MEKRVTIKDISQRTGVSPTTVTKALNGKNKISEEKRQEILRVAEEMGYKPNRFASALARNEVTIGIVIPKEPEVFFSSVIEGINAAIKQLEDERVRGIFCFLEENRGNLDEQLNELFLHNLSGLIISPGMFFKDNRILNRYIEKKKNIPILYLLNEIQDLPAAGCVRMNGFAAGRMACEVLSMAGGHRGRLAVMTEDNELQVHRECVAGFMQQAKECEVEVIEAGEMYDHYDVAYRLTKKLVEQHKDLTGIYVTSYKCTPVCNCLHDMGLTEQIAVVSQDLYPESIRRLNNKELCALIFQDPYEQGRIAVKKICRLILENEMVEESIILPHLVLRSGLKYYIEKYCPTNAI